MSEHVPDGWYQLTHASQIKKGKVYTFNYFNTALVCYRDSHHSIHVFDAYCPHLGAHLGIGGKIIKDLLVCPFHGWKYDAQGTCVEIPYCEKIPKRAQLQRYPVNEVNSLVFIYFGSQNELNLSSLPFLKHVSIRTVLTTQIEKTEFLNMMDTAKHCFNLDSYGSGIFIVKSTGTFSSLLITATPINSNKLAISLSTLREKKFINKLRSLIPKNTKKHYGPLFTILDQA
jgi:nitrite reductase/ring-hydroxylating ferredoxin subunit